MRLVSASVLATIAAASAATWPPDGLAIRDGDKQPRAGALPVKCWANATAWLECTRGVSEAYGVVQAVRSAWIDSPSSFGFAGEHVVIDVPPRSEDNTTGAPTPDFGGWQGGSLASGDAETCTHRVIRTRGTMAFHNVVVRSGDRIASGGASVGVVANITLASTRRGQLHLRSVEVESVTSVRWDAERWAGDALERESLGWARSIFSALSSRRTPPLPWGVRAPTECQGTSPHVHLDSDPPLYKTACGPDVATNGCLNICGCCDTSPAGTLFRNCGGYPSFSSATSCFLLYSCASPVGTPDTDWINEGGAEACGLSSRCTCKQNSWPTTNNPRLQFECCIGIEDDDMVCGPDFRPFKPACGSVSETCPSYPGLVPVSGDTSHLPGYVTSAWPTALGLISNIIAIPPSRQRQVNFTFGQGNLRFYQLRNYDKFLRSAGSPCVYFRLSDKEFIVKVQLPTPGSLTSDWAAGGVEGFTPFFQAESTWSERQGGAEFIPLSVCDIKACEALTHDQARDHNEPACKWINNNSTGVCPGGSRGALTFRLESRENGNQIEVHLRGGPITSVDKAHVTSDLEAWMGDRNLGALNYLASGPGALAASSVDPAQALREAISNDPLIPEWVPVRLP